MGKCSFTIPLLNALCELQLSEENFLFCVAQLVSSSITIIEENVNHQRNVQLLFVVENNRKQVMDDSRKLNEVKIIP